jgi:hypothetical protein
VEAKLGVAEIRAPAPTNPAKKGPTALPLDAALELLEPAPQPDPKWRRVAGMDVDESVAVPQDGTLRAVVAQYFPALAAIGAATPKDHPWAVAARAILTAAARTPDQGALLSAPVAEREPDAPGGWQPIETAPKDGTHVLLATDYGGVGEARWVEDAGWWYWANADHTDAWDGTVHNPTHWLPLPARRWRVASVGARGGPEAGVRVLVWYSDGAASACAAKLAVAKYGTACEVVKCDTTASEHPDNERFRADVEQWIGRPVTLIRSERYATVDEVFERRRYMAGISGAICTTELKKVVRLAYQRPDDTHVFGYTADEAKRIADFGANNPELACDWILRDQWVRKADCYRMLREAGIALPAMYALGYDHNNCLGCVKATSPGYWNRIRRDFPEVFARRAAQSRGIGVRLVRIEGERRYLDELPPDAGLGKGDGDIECGPFCHMPQADLFGGSDAEDAA